MDSKRDYYEILGVDQQADERELKRAYRKLAMENHPDRNPGDADAEARFKEAAEAYAILGDPEKRALYNRYGHAGLQGGGAPNAEDMFGGFSDLFEMFGFGGRGRANPNAPRRGDDLQMVLDIPFSDAVHGSEREVEIPRMVECDTCEGSGARPGTSPVTCSMCGGSGQVRRSQGLFQIQTTCPQCRGRGVVIQDPCPDCGGAGQKRRVRPVKVRIPAGVDTGNKLRVRGEGEGGHRGGPPGDLYIVLRVGASDLFERDGADLHLDLPIDFTLASLGGDVEIPTIDGSETLPIEAGTQPGATRVLRRKGLPRVNGGPPGDLVVHFRVAIPRKLSRRERELLAELASLRDQHVKEQRGLFGKIRDLFHPASTSASESARPQQKDEESEDERTP